MEMYHTFHDCGKPLVRTVDSEGKQHFPNHSEKSYEVFREVFKDNVNVDIISKFIRSDMTYHSYSMENIELFIKDNSKQFCISLWLTSFAEIYANKEMFDIDNQTSFKIKYKKLIKIFKKLSL